MIHYNSKDTHTWPSMTLAVGASTRQTPYLRAAHITFVKGIPWRRCGWPRGALGSTGGGLLAGGRELAVRWGVRRRKGDFFDSHQDRGGRRLVVDLPEKFLNFAPLIRLVVTVVHRVKVIESASASRQHAADLTASGLENGRLNLRHALGGRLFACSVLLGALSLLHTRHTKALGTQDLGIAPIRELREAAVGLFAAHHHETCLTDSHFGILVVKFVKLAHFEKKDEVVVPALKVPPKLLCVRLLLQKRIGDLGEDMISNLMAELGIKDESFTYLEGAFIVPRLAGPPTGSIANLSRVHVPTVTARS